MRVTQNPRGLLPEPAGKLFPPLRPQLWDSSCSQGQQLLPPTLGAVKPASEGGRGQISLWEEGSSGMQGSALSRFWQRESLGSKGRTAVGLSHTWYLSSQT